MSVMYKNGSSWSNLMLQAYPVGAVYISYVSTSPSSLFGGTWTPITGRFPYFNAGTSTGGANSQTIDFSHNHAQRLGFTSDYVNKNGIAYTNGGTVPLPVVFTQDSDYSGPIGDSPIGTQKKLGSKTISTVPPYQTFYAWRRTA